MDDKTFYFINSTITQLVALAGLGLGYYSIYHAHLAPKKEARLRFALKLADIAAELRSLLFIFELSTKDGGSNQFSFEWNESVRKSFEFDRDEEVMLVGLGQTKEKTSYQHIPMRLTHMVENPDYQLKAVFPGLDTTGHYQIKSHAFESFKTQLEGNIDLITSAITKLSGKDVLL